MATDETSQPITASHPPINGRRRRWLGLPTEAPVDGSLRRIIESLPQFGRQPFSMSSANGDDVGVNPFLDMVYRVPLRQGLKAVPVGVVSKNYRLIDHHLVLRTIEEALRDSGLDPDKMDARATWTTHGERAHFSLLFPPEDSYRIQLGANDEMRFRIEVFNSVEGSCRFMAVAGWLRFVCSNGLIIGSSVLRFRQQHRQQLQIEDFGRLLADALQAVRAEQAICQEWLIADVNPSLVEDWADEDVFKLWGFKAALRMLSMVRDGHDAEIAGDIKGRKPSEADRKQLDPVPGLNSPIDTVFGVSQALSWLAGQRQDISEEIEWRTNVAELIEKLRKRHEAAPQTGLFS